MAIYAPALIITLCRYEHLKKCLESLSANPWAKDTPVYVALDYPFKDEHWEGYSKIKEFLKGSFNFKKLNVIERTTNFGPYENSKNAIDQIFQEYDRIIISEDDNEFSPNFLEYINKGLEKFENDNSILAICGYMWPNTKVLYDENNFIKQRVNLNAWGYGIWKNRWQKFKSMSFKKYAQKNLRFPQAFCLFFKNVKIFITAMIFFRNNEDVLYDLALSLYMFNESKFCVQPVISKVKNNGFDGGGITSGVGSYNYFHKQVIDGNQTFSFIGEDENVKQNEQVLNKIGVGPTGHYIGKKYCFKLLVKYIILKIFGLEFLNKRFPIMHWGPKTFAEMRSAYLKQKEEGGDA